MDIWYYLMTPFTWMLKLFYGIFHNYGFALILFTLVVKVLLFPFSLKGKKGMIQMNMISAQQQKLQKQYGKDQARLNEEMQKLYEKEGVNPMGGCLWSLLPMLVLFPLYAIIRRPMKYWLGLPDAIITAVTTAVKEAGMSLSTGYPEISIASAFYKDPAILTAGQAAAEGNNLYGINFTFLGVDLSATPTLKFWENGWNWASIGLFLIPVLCVITSFLSSKIMMKTNEINSQASQQNSQNKMMQWMSPLMMLWFSFIMPAGMGLYIICNSVFSTVQEIICGKMLKKDYEEAAAAKARREQEEKEEEKRLRREKAEQRAREAEEARKNKGKAKEKAEEGGATPAQKAASRVGMRQYARGRAYDPDRFGGVTPYYDADIPELPTTREPEEDKAPDEPKQD